MVSKVFFTNVWETKADQYVEEKLVENIVFYNMHISKSWKSMMSQFIVNDTRGCMLAP